MRVYWALDEIEADAFPRGSAVAIGKFDGVHLGHQAILARVSEAAVAGDLDAVAFTFANNPLSFLRPEVCPAPLMSRDQRVRELAAQGLDAVVIVPFDADLAATSAHAYIEEILVNRLRVKHVIVGSDFRFGSRGAGDPDLLRELGPRFGFTVEEIANVDTPSTGRVSSTAVREAITAGDVERAARMLGRPVMVEGDVVRGDARGRELGFPTANLGGDVQGLVPADGVYAGWASVKGERHAAAISVGSNPTFTAEGESRVEAFLLDFSGDLYGEPMRVEFVARLRGMVAYTGVDDLIAQMHTDVADARRVLFGHAE